MTASRRRPAGPEWRNARRTGPLGSADARDRAGTGAQLDAKLSLLQALIVDADRAARRLEEALERAYPRCRREVRPSRASGGGQSAEEPG